MKNNENSKREHYLIENARLIARGRTADIFAWGSDRVIKLYRLGCSPDSIAREVMKARFASSLGIQTPAAIEIVRVDNNRTGIIFERVDGLTMLQVLQQQPQQAVSLAHLLAQLHVSLHAQKIAKSDLSTSCLPRQKERLRRNIFNRIDLDRQTQEAVLSTLATLPAGNTLCHGDFHPQNILIARNGNFIIDWFDASLGNPLGDVVRTLLILDRATLNDLGDARLQAQLKAIRRQFVRAYLEKYLQLQPLPQEQMLVWQKAIEQSLV